MLKEKLVDTPEEYIERLAGIKSKAGGGGSAP